MFPVVTRLICSHAIVVMVSLSGYQCSNKSNNHRHYQQETNTPSTSLGQAMSPPSPPPSDNRKGDASANLIPSAEDEKKPNDVEDEVRNATEESDDRNETFARQRSSPVLRRRSKQLDKRTMWRSRKCLSLCIIPEHDSLVFRHQRKDEVDEEEDEDLVLHRSPVSFENGYRQVVRQQQQTNPQSSTPKQEEQLFVDEKSCCQKLEKSCNSSESFISLSGICSFVCIAFLVLLCIAMSLSCLLLLISHG